MHHGRKLFLLLFPLLSASLPPDDFKIVLSNLSNTGGQICLANATQCSTFSCGRNDSWSNQTTEETAEGLAVSVFCKSSPKGAGQAQEIAIRLHSKGRRPFDRLPGLAWNIIAVTLNAVPVVVFVSIFVYHYHSKRPGTKREKEELRSIFQSLGVEDDGVLYKKIHDFIYE